MDIPRNAHSFRLQPIVLGLHLAFAGAVMAAPGPNELPTGGQVTYGSATISQPGAAQLQINQATQQATLNWNTFNIGAQAQVEFKQPNASAVALNRVVQADASVIEGKLTANGQVFLVNPSGVVFGKNAQVDVGGMVATTMKISDADFQRGNYQFSRDGATGEVVNQGQIRAANGGYVALVGATVRNEGTIQANHGTVALAAGDGARLEFGDGKLVNVQVDAATIKTLVENKQLIQAEGGRVLMTAVAASKLQGAVINNAGAIEANSLTSVGGVVRLEGADEIHNSGTLDASGATAGGVVQLAADSSGQASSAIHQSGVIKASATAGGGGNISLSASGGIDNSGRLDASGTTAGGNVSLALDGTGTGAVGGAPGPLVRQGGSIHANATNGVGGKVVLTGDYLQLDKGSLTTATGSTGGGAIYAGGGLHGSPLPLAGEGPGERAGNAKSTRVESGAVLDASATATGDGGIIVAWGTDASRSYGTFNAKGGPNGGNGGLVETSGHWLDVTVAKVDTKAPQGNSGDWLLDPYDVTITNNTTSSDSNPYPIVPGANVNWAPASNSSNVNASDIVGVLTGGNNITITTGVGGTQNGDINVNAPISWSTNNTFSLQASHNINVNASITATGNNAALALTANNNINVNANVEASGNNASLTLGYGTAVGNNYFTNNGAQITLSGGIPILKIGLVGSEKTYDQFIRTLNNLQNMQANLSGNYALLNDLDASSLPNFTPIGNLTSAFTGNFDGLGHAIHNLTINQPATDYVGLFGYANSIAEIRIANIGLVGVSITGSDYVGGLVGKAGSSSGNIVNISNAYNAVDANNKGAATGVGRVGGLVGEYFANVGASCICDSYSSVAVTGTGNRVGGLVGSKQAGLISQSYSHGPVTGVDYVGGLVGYNQLNIDQSYSTGSVVGHDNVGGLTGVHTGGASNTITNSYSTGAVSGNSNVGGFSGSLGISNLTRASIFGSYSTGYVTGNTNVGALIGRVFGVGSTTIYNSFWDIDTSGKAAGLSNAVGLGSNLLDNKSQTQLGSSDNPADLTTPRSGGGMVTTQMMTKVIYPLYDGTSNLYWNPTIWGWTTSSAAPAYPSFKWQFPSGPQTVSGNLLDSSGNLSTGASVAGMTIQGVENGVRLAQPAASTGNNGFYYFALSPSSIPTGNTLLTYQSGVSNPTGTVQLSQGSDLTNINLHPNWLTVMGSGIITSQNIADARGKIYDTLSNTVMPYKVDAAHIIVADNTELHVANTLTGFTLENDISTNNQPQFWNTPITLAADAVLSSGSGTINLVNNVSGQAFNFGLDTSSVFTQGLGTSTPDQSFKVGGLSLLGGGTYLLKNTGNQISILAGNFKSIDLLDNASLTVGSIGTTNGVTAGLAVTLQTTGATSDITLNQAISSGATGDAVILAAGQNFINNVGANAIALNGSGTPRWLVYSQDPAANTFGSLNSGQIPIWKSTYASNPPSGITQTGNRYLFAITPTLTFGSIDYTKKYYGDSAALAINTKGTGYIQVNDPTNKIYAYNLGVANVFAGDDNAYSVSGSAVTSLGAADTAHVSVLPYAMTMHADAFTSTDYSVAVKSNGKLTVSPRPVTLTVADQSRYYGSANPAAGTVTNVVGGSGFVFNDSVSGVSVTSRLNNTSHAGVAAPLIGSNPTLGGTGTNNSTLADYAFTLVDGVLNINPANLTLTANNQFKLYGNVFTFTGKEFTSAGLQNNETIGSVALTSEGAPASANVGNYAINITPGSATGGTFTPSNYSITYNPGNMQVSQTRLILDLTANNQSKSYGVNFVFTGNEFSAVGLENGDTISSVQLTSAGAPALAPVGNYSINITPGSAVGNYNSDNYSIAYVNGSLIVDPRQISLTAGSNPFGSRLFGDLTNPPVGYDVGGLGMANGEKAQAVFGFTVGSAANGSTPAGIYWPGTALAYKIGGVDIGFNGNYDITALYDGTMTILPRPQTSTGTLIAQDVEPKLGTRYAVNPSGNLNIGGDDGEFPAGQIGLGRRLLIALGLLPQQNQQNQPDQKVFAASANQSDALELLHSIWYKLNQPDQKVFAASANQSDALELLYSILYKLNQLNQPDQKVFAAQANLPDALELLNDIIHQPDQKVFAAQANLPDALKLLNHIVSQKSRHYIPSQTSNPMRASIFSLEHSVHPIDLTHDSSASNTRRAIKFFSDHSVVPFDVIPSNISSTSDLSGATKPGEKLELIVDGPVIKIVVSKNEENEKEGAR